MNQTHAHPASTARRPPSRNPTAKGAGTNGILGFPVAFVVASVRFLVSRRSKTEGVKMPLYEQRSRSRPFVLNRRLLARTCKWSLTAQCPFQAGLGFDGVLDRP
jgi:hypothetical protein